MPYITIQGTSIAFLSLSGRIHRLGANLEEITRPAYDGHAYRDLGRRARPSELLGTVDCDDGAVARLTVDRLSAGRGNLVDVKLDDGQEYTDLMLLDVEEVQSHAIAKAVGGLSSSKAWILAVRIVVQQSK